ncbi:type IX secretion system membrane protein PorP/SprF [Polaribacter aestuariivivens]|uniref:Type IX secretion system membrane protein PorP/SprF n=1 Tax=Polaribacter aestuariivivens TaxID=2304626 RepID=A0A5S3NBC0_9FLAO|nr:type IX secretion system membrane protein PorP/SprF [Polaribacter aestuariivivens]TMM32483.1 type IX secretion system membrane protein PorP/SprF [Polaribacter aestuariivivens]
MKKLIVIIAVVLFTVSAKAQQDPQYTQYMYNMNIINPAYAGSYDAMSINLLGRSQWVDIDGAPRTLTMGINSPVGKNVGLGLSVIVDEIGPVEEQNVYGDFSYTLKVGENAKLALGLKAGFTFFNICLPCLNTVNGGDQAFVNQNANKVMPNIGAGAFYYTDKFYAGLSIPNMLKTFHFDGSQTTRASETKHFFFTSGYVFDLSNDVKLKPSTMIKAAEGSPLSIDFSGNVLLYDKLEFGLSYRLDESVSALINVRASRSLRIGYAYDYTLTNLGNFNSGSHEIFVLFNFDFDRNKIKSPRFF